MTDLPKVPEWLPADPAELPPWTNRPRSMRKAENASDRRKARRDIERLAGGRLEGRSANGDETEGGDG